MRNLISILIGGVFILLAMEANANAQTTLKDAYRGQFLIGVAVNDAQVQGKKPGEDTIIKTQFNSISPENALKWDATHPAADKYTFTQADRFVEYGVLNGMFVIGHTLVWHSQTPAWVFAGASGNPATRDELLARMREHIHSVVGRYKGKVRGWDVVNEALEENGTLRDSPWKKIIGDDYIAMAFRYAHEADPFAELYYNDYRLEQPRKRAGAIEMLKKLKSSGVPITGVGIQGHGDLTQPKLENIDAAITDFGKLGLKVMITELDVDVLPNKWDVGNADINQKKEANPALNPYTEGLPANVQQDQAKRYADLFSLYRKHPGILTRVTLWGVTDSDSWLNDFPVGGRTNYPLLFDRAGKPKPAFEAVMKAAVGNSPSF
jgi:endo-1,4-beta-xylanase